MTIELQQNESVPSARINVFEPGTKPRHADFQCKIGRDLTINPDLLSRYCVRDLDPVVDDLVLISGSVAFADRVVARKPSIAWRRNLSISIPMHKPDRWRE